MYVKFNLMPDTYLVVAIVYGAGGRGAGIEGEEYLRENFLKLTDKEKEKNNNLLAAEDMLRTTVS